MQLALPDRLGLHPKWLLPGLEAVLLLALVFASPGRLDHQHPALRSVELGLVALLSVSNAISAGLLVRGLVAGSADTGRAGSLLAAGAGIYLTNVLAFGLWLWIFDRGGPVARAHGRQPYPDLMFAQMASPDLAPPHWEPLFVDYLYVSFTNATAFSPTDTLPLSRWVKALLAVQSAVALVVIALVVARAVNVLR